MQAFNNDPKFKIEVIENAKKHQKQDDYMRGTYYEDDSKEFKGCSVGCTIYDINKIKGFDGDYSDHEFLADQLCVPEFVAHLQDHFFENVSDDLLKNWTVDFFEAIPVGADLTSVLPKFLLFIVQDVQQFCDESNIEAVKDVETVLKNWIKTGEVDKKEAARAADAAADAAWSAARAAEAAARAAEAAWSADAAADAAWSAARAAAAAARAAEAAWSADAAADAAEAAAAAAEAAARAADAAMAAEAAWSAEAAAWSAARAAEAAESSATDKYAIKFLELMRGADHEQD